VLISIIAAVADNGIIGRQGDLPWRLPADMRYFRRVTMGKPVLMGQRTFESIGKPLKGRATIVLTDDPSFTAEGCVVRRSIDDALDAAAASGADEVMIAGGASVYAQLLPRADRLYLTEVHAEIEGDVSFPEVDARAWREISRQARAADEKNLSDVDFVIYERAV